MPFLTVPLYVDNAIGTWWLMWEHIDGAPATTAVIDGTFTEVDACGVVHIMDHADMN